MARNQGIKMSITNKNNEKLAGLLLDSGSPEVVILCHGFRSKKENRTMVNLAVALQKEGISSFHFDFAGNGKSEGSFRYGHYWREAEDLRSVIEHFIVENRRVAAILGHSKGGNVVLLYASKYHDVPIVINVSGRYNMWRGIEQWLGNNFLERIKKEGFIDVKNKSDKYRVTEESLMDRLNTNMQEACSEIDKKCRVMTIYGSDDENIPLDDAMMFEKMIPNHKLHIIKGANHVYSSHQHALASVAVSFINQSLQQQM